VKYWVGVTDNHWFNFLSEKRFEEVNFWQPSATPAFNPANVPTGMPFLFKLKRPHNHIAGGGFFITFSILPLPLAWEVFGEKNGASSIEEFRELVEPLASGHRKPDADIGCSVLANPFFLDPSHWISDPPGWASNIVRGKMFDSTTTEGQHIWDRVRSHLEFRVEPNNLEVNSISVIHEQSSKYGSPISVRPRLGQSSFRILVTEAYKRKCAITGESTLIALEAAHIVPYSKDSNHDVRNGLLLRADFHRLFDVGLVSVTPDLQIRISPRIREAWFNGKIYYRLDKQPLAVLPDKHELRPDPDRLEWHYKNVFQS